MALEDYKSLVGGIATVVTIIQFLSGFDICRKIRSQGSTGDISGFPFIVGLFSSSLWFTYGYLINDNSVMITNAVGTFVQLLYLGIYFHFCTAIGPVKTMRRQFILLICITIAIYIYCHHANIPQQIMINHIGLICCVSSIVFAAAPLASIKIVMQTKSTDSLPFPLLLCMFFVTGLWALYGFIIHNVFVIYQNLIGFTIVGLQLSLFAIYPSKTKDSTLLLPLVST